ncbi:MAG: hypothetical protein PVH87_13710 [Desulfobacteraceae bacterium]|jgi:hypothetical protein
MKVFLAFCFFFGSILGVGALLLFCFLLAPSEYTLDKDVVKIDSGTFRHPERIFPDLPVKSRYNYPGMQASLKAKNTNTTAFVLVPRDAEEARSIFKNYAEQYLQGILSRNSGICYYNYKKKELGVAGRMKLLEGVIVHVEGKDYPSVDQAIDRSALLVRNPEANFFTDIAHTDKYLLHILVYILLYVALLFPLWCRVASWAATVPPKPGIEPVNEDELRQRLLAVNEADSPLQVVEGKKGKMDIVWRLADAKWAGLMTLNKLKRTQIIRIKLSGEDAACRAIDISKTVRGSADARTLHFGFGFSFFRGIVFFQKEYETQYGLFFKEGRLAIDNAYRYTFNSAEMKSPVMQIVRDSGWRYKPVIFFSRWLSG